MPKSVSGRRIVLAVLAGLVLAVSARAQPATTMEDSVLRRVEQIPDFMVVLSRFNAYYARDSVESIMYVEGIPNDSGQTAIERKNYQIYVGESHTDHSVRWFSLLVSKDLQTVKFYDIVEDRIHPVGYWRRQWPATRFLKRRPPSR